MLTKVLVTRCVDAGSRDPSYIMPATHIFTPFHAEEEDEVVSCMFSTSGRKRQGPESAVHRAYKVMVEAWSIVDGKPLQQWMAVALCTAAACAAVALQQLDRQSVAIGFTPHYLPDRPLKFGQEPDRLRLPPAASLTLLLGSCYEHWHWF